MLHDSVHPPPLITLGRAWFPSPPRLGYYRAMASTPVTALASIPSAFAAACRLSRTEGELFERCRVALVRRFRSERIWFGMVSGAQTLPRVGPADGFDGAVEVARLGSGESEVVIHADAEVAGEMRAVAMPLALGLSVVLELRSILLERQAALDDAVFQLRALRQVARLLSSVHSIEDTEQLILDFMAEVFFAWWACLYRPEGDSYAPKVFRSLNDRLRPGADRPRRARPRAAGRQRERGRRRCRRGVAGRPGRRAGGAARRRRGADGGAGARAPGSATSCTGGRSWSWRAPCRSRPPSRSRTRSWSSSSTARPPPTSSPASTTAGRWRNDSGPRSPAASATSSTPACCSSTSTASR